MEYQNLSHFFKDCGVQVMVSAFHELEVDASPVIEDSQDKSGVSRAVKQNGLPLSDGR